jgi:hypothetical protein
MKAFETETVVIRRPVPSAGYFAAVVASDVIAGGEVVPIRVAATFRTRGNVHWEGSARGRIDAA